MLGRCCRGSRTSSVSVNSWALVTGTPRDLKTTELELTDPEDYEPRFPQYEKRPYTTVFEVPGPDWKVEAVWEDAYYKSAKRLLEGVAQGEYLPAYEGVAGLYLFRHYVELALKFIIFHSRWLRDKQSNARFDEIEDVKEGHGLRALWDLAEKECQRVIRTDEWLAMDIEFVEKCILEFESIDPHPGVRFRYPRFPGSRFGVEKDAAKRAKMTETIRYDLYIHFGELPATVEHVHDVLNYLDVYMLEKHGLNEEWGDYLNSL